MYYEKIELETSMTAPTLYRTTPYQFDLTAEPGQFVMTCGRIIAGESLEPSKHDTLVLIDLPDLLFASRLHLEHVISPVRSESQP